MSKTLSVAQAKFFDDQIKIEYAAMGGALAPTVYKKFNRGVKTFQFPKLTNGVAQRRTSQTMVKLMNVTHTNVIATGEEWQAAEFTDIFDDAETNIDERKALAGIIASAINRREDQILIDAWEVATANITIDVNEGGANTGLNVAKLRAAGSDMDDNEVGTDGNGKDTNDRHFAAGSKGKSSLLAETEVTSTDFNSVRALVAGQVNQFLGFEFHWVGLRAEGGFDLTGNTRTNFAYHGGMRGSTGLGMVMKDEVNTTFENLFSSWLSVQNFIAGAVVIDPVGLVEVQTFEP